MNYIEKVVDGERFRFPEQYLNEYEFWLGGDNGFGHRMALLIDGKVGIQADTGMCENQAIVTKWTPLTIFMEQKCRAEHLGPTDEKKKQVRTTKRRGRPRKSQ